jgi:hypothetical protein
MNPATRAVALPPSVAANPRLGDWLRILPSGVVEIRPGKVELGQGVLTALSQVAAEELDISVARVRTVPPATGVSPDEGYTAGSLSIQHSGAAIRLVCAEARGRYLAGAAASLGVPESKLTVADGQILAPDGRSTSYWELADDALLDRAASGEYQPKAASAYHVVGTSVPRVDLPDKLTGRPRFVHDLSPDGLCYGRIVRPPSRGATLTALDATTALALPGVLTVVRDGSFLGVVAERGLRRPAGLPAFGAGRDGRARRTWHAPGRRADRDVGRGHLPSAVSGPRVHGAIECHRPVRRRGGQSAPGVVTHPGHLPAAGRTRPRAWSRRRRRHGHARGGSRLLRPQRCRRRRHGRRPARPGRPGSARPGGLEPGRRTDLGAIRRGGRGARRRRRGRGRERPVLAARDMGERALDQAGLDPVSRAAREQSPRRRRGDRSRRGTADGARRRRRPQFRA